MRYDRQASILGVADLRQGQSRDRLEQERRPGPHRCGDAGQGRPISAIISGLGDARKFLAGGIDAGRARMLLAAQIGASAAAQRIASTGDATQAHRQWLLGFIDRRIRPEAFAA